MVANLYALHRHIEVYRGLGDNVASRYEHDKGVVRVKQALLSRGRVGFPVH